jgi:hypothetical protein
MSCPSVPNSDYFEESVVNMDDLIMQKSVVNLTMLSTMPVFEQRILKNLLFVLCRVQLNGITPVQWVIVSASPTCHYIGHWGDLAVHREPDKTIQGVFSILAPPDSIIAYGFITKLLPVFVYTLQLGAHYHHCWHSSERSGHSESLLSGYHLVSCDYFVKPHSRKKAYLKPFLGTIFHNILKYPIEVLMQME